jgi:hypothetical protein
MLFGTHTVNSIWSSGPYWKKTRGPCKSPLLNHPHPSPTSPMPMEFWVEALCVCQACLQPQLWRALHQALARRQMLLVFVIPLCMLAEQNMHRRGCHHMILKVNVITTWAPWFLVVMLWMGVNNISVVVL